jgi:hypothetical protein
MLAALLGDRHLIGPVVDDGQLFHVKGAGRTASRRADARRGIVVIIVEVIGERSGSRLSGRPGRT